MMLSLIHTIMLPSSQSACDENSASAETANKKASNNMGISCERRAPVVSREGGEVYGCDRVKKTRRRNAIC